MASQMGSLTVHFRGICVHFPCGQLGVPHRVVLPDARALRRGSVETPGLQENMYALPPHFAVRSMRGVRTTTSDVEGFRLHVENGLRDGVRYEGCFFDHVLKIKSFVEPNQLRISGPVVEGGQASCYFDVTDGVVEPDPPPPSGPPCSGPGGAILTGVQITIRTDGPPVLVASPLPSGPDQTPRSRPISLPRLDKLDMIIGNVDHGPDGGADGLDFLLNFLVLEGGIPTRILQPLPKPPRESVRAQRDEASEVGFPRYEELLSSSTISCSNTQFP